MHSRFVAHVAQTGKAAATPARLRPHQHQSSADLLVSLAVFNLCAVKPLVAAFPVVTQIAEKTHTAPLLHALVKQTFFKHFCGGENLAEVVPKMKNMQEANVGAILDLAVEADLDAGDLTGIEARVATKNMVDQLKDTIDIASHTPDSFIAAKVTALVPPSLLLRWSATLNKLESAFDQLADSDGKISCEQFQKLSETFPAMKKQNLFQIFNDNDLDKTGFLSYADVTALFSLFSIHHAEGLLLEDQVNFVSRADLDTAAGVIEEIKVFCDYARTKEVKLMMDAEQTYFQPAIDDIVRSLCRLYNTPTAGPTTSAWTGPVIYNTYQMYLTSSLKRLQMDVHRAAQRGYSYGIKLVRGAYMVSERERAMRLGYPSPIHPTMEATHEAYDEAINFILEQQSVQPRVADAVRGLSLVVASHNHESVKLTQTLMDKYGIPRSGGWVSFGQLQGMQDAATFKLASEGYTALKYLPYGPVPVAMAYLHRRAEENSSMVAAMESDKKEIVNELKLRLGL